MKPIQLMEKKCVYIYIENDGANYLRAVVKYTHI